jgi:CHAT domain-containing protein
MLLSGWSGTPPEVLYREGEVLRLRYEKSASEQAISSFRAAAAAWTRSHDLRQAARASQRVGMTYTQLGLLQQALDAHREALAQAKASGDLSLESETLSDVGTARSFVAVREGEFEEAGRHCEASLELARQAHASRAEAKALMCLGEVAYNHGERERALDLYVRAGILSVRAGDTRAQAEALLYEGTVYSDQSEFVRAEDCLTRSKQAWAALGDARGTAIALVAMSKLHQRRGEYQTALNGLQEALVIVNRMGDAVWQGVILTAFGSVYLQLGDADNAIAYWERARERFTTAALNSFSVDLLISLGNAYLASGDDGKALDRFERALALGTDLADDHWQAYALRAIGAVHLSRADRTTAATFFERSLAVQERIRDPQFEAATRADLGEAWRLAGDLDRARTSFQLAVSLSRAAEFRLGEARGLDGLARVALGSGDLDAARRHIEQALALVESVRSGVPNRDLRASYVASVHRYHETHVDALMRLHRAHPGRGLDADAFEASEQARARSLLDGLAEAGVDLRKDLAPALLEREQALQQEFDAWAAQQRQALDLTPTAALAKRLADEYRGLEARHAALDAEIRSRSPRYAAVARPRPLTLRQVQQHVLDTDTILLEYAQGETRSYLWAVWKTGSSVHDLPSRTEISEAARELYRRLTARLSLTGSLQERRRRAEEADFLYWEQARHLSDLLLGPVAKAIAGKRIAIVADGALQYVPFAALPIPGGDPTPVPLMAGHEVVNLPSASALEMMRQETAGRAPPAGALAVLADPVFERDDPRLRAALRGAEASDDRRPGNQPAGMPASPAPGSAGSSFKLPRLAATRLEADAILAAAGTSATLRKLDFDASRSAATSPELAQYRIVHFATHGLFDNQNPGLSGIMLSMFDAHGRPQDGFLRLQDIYDLNLPADLVVLSACSSALGREVSGEGLVGIVRGFMYAGAKRVVASLWKVDDEATGDLMRRFYARMLRDHLPPAAALREAQLGIWRQSRWKAPFYWAAFSLQGEWRP